MPTGKIFKKPEVAPIVRDNDIIRPDLKGTSAEETFKKDSFIPPKQELPIEGVEPVKFIDAFQRWVNDKLDVIIKRSTVVEAEAIALQNQIVAQIDRSLDKAPSTVIEALTSLIEEPLGPELTECQLSCVAIASGMYGQQQDEDLSAKMDSIQANSANDLTAFQNEVNNVGPKVTGLWLFFFMVRFIIAFCVHVTVGFMCCYLRNKLIFKVGPFKVKLGEKIAKPVGALEAVLKDILGFPCGTGDAKCLEPGQSPVEDDFRMFPCCNPDGDPGWDSCGTQSGEAQLQMPTLSTCFNNVIRRVADEATGDPSSPDGSKPCRVGECEPDEWNQREREAAKHAMEWLLAKSQATKNSLNEAQRNAQQPQMKSDIDFYHSQNATRAIDTSRSSRTIAQGFKSSFNDNYSYTGSFSLTGGGRNRLCDLDLSQDNPFKGLNSFGDMTQDDIKRALKNNVDTSFVNELRAAEAEGTNLEFDGSQPPFEPFKSIYDAVNMLDDTLGSVLEEIRKAVTSAKMLSNLLTDKTFCCIIYAIVVLGNLIRFQKLCPEKDLQDLFDYAQDFGDNADVKKLIKFLKLLQKLIDAINADLLGNIEGIGLGLPLGTMLELIKKAIASSVMALLAIALAPIDNALTNLANNPKLKALFNDNCFGVGDLFAMFGCGIKWIYDLIKQWLMELIPFKAKNIELLANFRITGFKMKFLSKLSDILKMLIDLLLGIGDCFPPENIPPAIMNQLADQPVGSAPEVLAVPAVPPAAGKGISQYRSIAFEQIGNQVMDVDSTGAPLQIFPDSRQDVILEMTREAQSPTPGLGFPIYSEAVKVGFIDLIATRNGLSLPQAQAAEDFTNLQPSNGYVPDPSKSREEILQNVLNMVQNLKDIK